MCWGITEIKLRHEETKAQKKEGELQKSLFLFLLYFFEILRNKYKAYMIAGIAPIIKIMFIKPNIK